MTLDVRIGVVGAGYMGRSHATAYRNVAAIFGAEPARPLLDCVADVNMESAVRMQEDFGFLRSTDDWREIIDDPGIDAVDICAPNGLHREIALAAARAGKHIYCEKPLAMSSTDSRQMMLAAQRSGVVTLVGFTYMHNPVQAYVRELLDSGEIGEVVQFRTARDQDIMADPALPFSWRHDRALAGPGALGDNGVHALSLSQMMVGDIVELCAMAETFIKERPVAKAGSGYAARNDKEGGTRRVENDDVAVILVKYRNGATGTIESSRIGTGRKAGPQYELQGTRGTIVFDQQYLNEVQICRAGGQWQTQRLSEVHPGSAPFHVGGGMQLGFNDQKIVEARRFVVAIAGGEPIRADFEFGHKICVAVDAVLKSVDEKRWVSMSEIDPRPAGSVGEVVR